MRKCKSFNYKSQIGFPYPKKDGLPGPQDHPCNPAVVGDKAEYSSLNVYYVLSTTLSSLLCL